MAEPTKPTDPNTGMPVEAAPPAPTANKGQGSLTTDPNTPALSMNLPPMPIDLKTGMPDLGALAPKVQMTKPVTSQTIPAVSPGSLSRPSKPTPYAGPGELTPEAQRMQTEAEGGAVAPGPAMIIGQEVDLGERALSDEEREAIYRQASPAEQAAIAKAAERERQRVPSRPDPGRAGSTSEKVREKAVPTGREQAFRHFVIEGGQRLVETAEGKRADLTGVRAVDQILAPLASQPSDAIGAAVAADLTSRGYSEDIAKNTGMAVAATVSAVYSVKSPTAFGNVLMGGTAKQAPHLLKAMAKLKQLSLARESGILAEGSLNYLERTAGSLLGEAKYARTADNLIAGLKASDGATVNPALGPVKVGPEEAVVSIVPSRGKTIEGREATREDALAFVKKNADLLDSYPGLSAGVWKDTETGITHFDLSMKTDPDTAQFLGKANRQKSIYLGTGETERVHQTFDVNEGPHGHGYTPSEKMRPEDIAVAKEYDAAPLVDDEAVPAWRELITHVKDDVTRNILPRLRVEYVTGQPYANHLEMNADIAQGVLRVSKDNADHPVWSPEDNLLFRVWHDYHHHFETGADFSLEGEWTATQAALGQAGMGLSPKSRAALGVEVHGQAAAAIAHTGEFQPQKIYIPGKKYAAREALKDELAGLQITQQTKPHSPIADTLEAAAAQELADVPRGTRVMVSPSGFGTIEARPATRGAEVFHGTGAGFAKANMQGGLWVAAKPETAGRYAELRASQQEQAANIRPYYLAPDAKLADEKVFDELVAGGAREGEIISALVDQGYDGVAFTGDISKITGKGDNYWIFNPLVLTEKFTGQTAAMVAMSLAGAAAGAQEGEEGGAVAGAMAGLVFKGKGTKKAMEVLSRAEVLAKSTSGGLRYLTRPVNWSEEGKNSKAVNALANVGAAMIARGEVVKPEEVLAGLVVRFGDGILAHAETIVMKAQANFERTLKGVDMRPTEDVVRFFQYGDSLPDWYASGERIRQVFGPDTDLIANLIAATSAHNPNERSVNSALAIYAAMRTGKFDPKDGASLRSWIIEESKANADFRLWTMATHYPNIERAFLGQELSGNKVSNYARAILGDENAVVVDTHIMNALLLEPGSEGGKITDISGNVVPDWVTEVDKAAKAEGISRNAYIRKNLFNIDSIYSYFEGIVRKFAEENGVTPRYAQQAIWVGRVHEEGMVEGSVQALPDMFIDIAKSRGYDKLFPFSTPNGLAALGVATALIGAGRLAEQDGGVTEDHIAMTAGLGGLAGNKRVMKVVIEAVRRLRSIPGKVAVLPPATAEQAMDVLTHPIPVVKAGDKLLGMDWVGMSQDADHLPQTIKIVQSVFEDAIKADSRGVVSHDMERQMAETMIELGLEPESAIAKWKEGGREVVSTEIMAVAALTKGAYDETRRLADLATRYEGDPRGAKALTEFGRALGVFSSLAVVLGGQAEESGRALGVFRALVPEIPKGALQMGRKHAELEAKGLTPGARAAAEGARAAEEGAEIAQGAVGTGPSRGVQGAGQVPGQAAGTVPPQAPQRGAGEVTPQRAAGAGAPPAPPGAAQQQAQQQAAQYLVTLLQAWQQLPKSAQRGRFVVELRKWGFDLIKEVFYNNFLMTFPGQIANLAGSAQAVLGEQLSKFVGIGIGSTIHALGRKTPPAALNEITEGTFTGMMGSIGEAMVFAGRSYVSGMPESRDIMGASATKVPRAVSGERVQDVMALANVQIPNAVYHGINVLGMTLGVGSRAMMSGDEFMKVTAFRGELHRLAIVEGNRQGLKGNALTGFVQQYLADPPAEDIDAARKYAHYVTFTSPMEGTLAAISKVGKSTLMLPFTPFFDTLANIFKYDLEWMLGPNLLVKKSREDLITPGPRQDQALAKLGIGSAMLVFSSWLYMNGYLNGPGPRDGNMKRDLTEIEKYVPNAFVMRDEQGKKHQFGINRFDPGSFPFVFAAAYGDIALEALNGRAVSLETLDELAIAGAMALGEVAQTRNYMQGFEQTLSILLSKDPKDINKMAKVGQRIAGMVIPSGVAQINRNIDENVRSVYSALDMIYSRLPGYSKELMPDVNMKGEPKFKTAALGPDFMSPIPYAKGEPDPVVQSWRENGVSIDSPGRSLFGPPPPPLMGEETSAHGIVMSAPQQHKYEVLAGNGLKVKSDDVLQGLRGLGFMGELPEKKMGMWDIQTALLKTPGFTNLESASRALVQRSVVQGFRRAAAGEMVRTDKDIREKLLGKVLDRAETFGGPRARAQAQQAIESMDIDALLEMIGEGTY